MHQESGRIARAAGAVLLLSGMAAAAPQAGEAAGTLRTGDYLGETPPGRSPALFAPGLVSTDLRQRDTALSPDGKLFYFTLWGQGEGTLVGLERRDGTWSKPEIVSLSGTYSDLEPFFDPTGAGIYFASKRPLPGESAPGDWNLWFSPRQESGWGEPRPLGSVNGDGDEFYPSVTRDGTVYFTAEREDAIGGEDLYRARRVGEGWGPAENLGAAVNSPGPEFNAFVSADETILIFSSLREGDSGGGDLYYSVREKDGSWSPAVNMGPGVNSPALDYCPFLTPDGRYFFFTSSRATPASPDVRRSYARFVEALHEPQNGQGSIYWMDARGLFGGPKPAPSP